LEEALGLHQISAQEYTLAITETERLMEELAAAKLPIITDCWTHYREAVR
jgi:hypothetical protein